MSGKLPVIPLNVACPFFCGVMPLYALWPETSFLSCVDIALSTRSKVLGQVDVTLVKTMQKQSKKTFAMI